MSYSLRNTLLLAATLLLMICIGSLWLYFGSYKELGEIEEKNEVQRAEFLRLNAIAVRFTEVFEQNETLTHRIDHYPKTLFPSHRLPHLYDYLRLADRGSVFMNFTFSDSTAQGNYGRMRFNVDGVADYRQLRDFIYTVEHSSPTVRITDLQLRPTSNQDNLHEVGFRMNLAAFYNRGGRNVIPTYAEQIRGELPHNPFFPLIHGVAPNANNLIEPERSRLQAITDQAIFLYDQGNQLRRLQLRERVHLGYLESISAERSEATFLLNKGGIIERVTLRINP
ncbi:Tfp pilus assembly protein PilO [Cyclonatronum proteinivorum]|uniref:Tfp pilus assembly protein PilO n=1 Tax=Cyclonatronum proteinivorum TaxID=1457365 RepID=A0A345UH26_9BACT|nr:hypothetical protein [Cyclonatronum proteinivorum]AXI99777.1 Tfp pilus assembly protein PilO [Cyclonatronum proteinivorum]